MQTIHVVPKCRGPAQLSRLMWDRALREVEAAARADNVAKVVKFTTLSPDCQAPQGANFWINKMGWGGTDAAKKAAHEHSNKLMTSKKAMRDPANMWYDLELK